MWICVYRFSRKKERWGKGIDERENTMLPEWLQIYISAKLGWEVDIERHRWLFYWKIWPFLPFNQIFVL